MLVHTITFEIHDFKNNTSEKFLVHDTIDNQEMILSNRYTRNIKLSQMFSFQFEREMRIPLEMISMSTWVRMATVYPELIATVAEFESL